MHVDNITKYTCRVKEVKTVEIIERGGWNPMMKQILQLLPIKTVLELYNEISDASMAV